MEHKANYTLVLPKKEGKIASTCVMENIMKIDTENFDDIRGELCPKAEENNYKLLAFW